MNVLRTAILILILAGIAGALGVPVIAIALSLVGLFLLDLILIGGLWRLISHRRGDDH